MHGNTVHQNYVQKCTNNEKWSSKEDANKTEDGAVTNLLFTYI